MFLCLSTLILVLSSLTGILVSLFKKVYFFCSGKNWKSVATSRETCPERGNSGDFIKGSPCMERRKRPGDVSEQPLMVGLGDEREVGM